MHMQLKQPHRNHTSSQSTQYKHLYIQFMHLLVWHGPQAQVPSIQNRSFQLPCKSIFIGLFSTHTHICYLSEQRKKRKKTNFWKYSSAYFCIWPFEHIHARTASPHCVISESVYKNRFEIYDSTYERKVEMQKFDTKKQWLIDKLASQWIPAGSFSISHISMGKCWNELRYWTRTDQFDILEF